MSWVLFITVSSANRSLIFSATDRFDPLLPRSGRHIRSAQQITRQSPLPSAWKRDRVKGWSFGVQAGYLHDVRPYGSKRADVGHRSQRKAVVRRASNTTGW